MARLRGRAAAATGREQLDLVEALRADLYKHDFTEEELHAAWDLYGAQIMAEGGRGPGTRPLGWWRFVAGEEPPRDRSRSRNARPLA